MSERNELRFLSAGLEFPERSTGIEPFIRIVASTASGATRTIRLTEDEAVNVIRDLSHGIVVKRERGGS